MSWTKTGGELLVNTTTTDYQDEASVAALTGGGFVVTWTDTSATGGDTIGWAVRGQQYDSTGAKVGGEFLVNTTTTGTQFTASVAALTGGGFVVTWTDTSATGGDTSLEAVRGQQYDSTGTKVSGEFLVNTTTANTQQQPSVAGLIGGGFVVTWTDWSATGGDTSFSAVRGQQYDSTGTKVSGEFLVNTTTANTQQQPSVVALAGGGFVVTWTDTSATGGDTTGWAVRGQQYDSTGIKVGGEFLVNSTTVSDQFEPSVTGLADGGFVVTWTDASSTGGDTNWAVRGQQYDSTGAKVGGEFLVNTTTANTQQQPSVAALTGGGFVVTWSDTSFFAIRAQIYSTPANPNLFLLSPSIDPITGTANADTLRGAAADLQAGDALDGGADIDTFEITTGPTLDLRIPGTFTGIERLRGTTGNDRVILDGVRGLSTIDGGTGTDTLEYTAPTFDLTALAVTLTDVEELYMAESGTTTLTVRAADLAAITTFAANTTADTGVDTLATPAATFDLTGKTLTNIDKLQALIATGATITPPAAWVGTITGGAGNDVITITQTSTSTVEGGLGTDTVVITGAGAITLPTTTDVEAIVYNGGTNQTITLAAAEVRTLAFGTGADVITGGLNPDRVFLGAGNDSFTGGNGGDLAVGEAGADTLEGGQGADTLFGGTLGSKLDGGTESDTLVGGGGDDTILGGGDTLANLVFGGAGNDSVTGAGILVGGTGADTLIGSTGADTLFGEAGANVLNGGSGDDILIGGADAETIIGGLGNDTVWGSGGADRFTMTSDTSTDVIADFAIGVDKLDLAPLGISAAGFAALTQTPMSNGVTLVLSATQSVSLIGVTTVVIGDVITT